MFWSESFSFYQLPPHFHISLPITMPSKTVKTSKPKSVSSPSKRNSPVKKKSTASSPKKAKASPASSPKKATDSPRKASSQSKQFLSVVSKAETTFKRERRVTRRRLGKDTSSKRDEDFVYFVNKKGNSKEPVKGNIIDLSV